MLSDPLVKQTIQQVAQSIAAVLNVDIMILDNNFKVVGGTVKNQNKYFISNVYKYIMSTGKPVIIEEPGFNDLCKGCKKHGNCPELVEFDYPIKFEEKTIGILSLVGYTVEYKEKMIARKNEYMIFLERMCEMISTKVLEVSISKQLRVAALQMTHIFNSVSEGIIAIDGNGVITHCSKAAEKLLKIQVGNIIGKSIIEFIPDFINTKELDGTMDYSKKETRICRYNGGEIQSYISTNPIIDEDKNIIGEIITIFDSSDIKKMVQDMMGYDNKNVQFSDIIGESQIFNNVKQKSEIAAKGQSTILIRGESGTGKELFARSIHNSSLASNGPFIAINCAAIPEALLESELFGYEGGAFTGAKKEGKPGKFELADGGTLFLDEIGDMPLYLQAKLLRVLQGMRIQRVGGLKDIEINVRIISATNKNLEELVSENRFREDLFYRLNVIPIFIPPLIERREDIPFIVDYLLNKYNALFNKNIKSIDEQVNKIFMSYSWPGNVRELENILEYAMNMENDQVITEQSLPGHLVNTISIEHDEQRSLENMINDYEKKILLGKIKEYGISLEAKKLLAEELNIGIATLYRKLKSHNIEL